MAEIVPTPIRLKPVFWQSTDVTYFKNMGAEF